MPKWFHLSHDSLKKSLFTSEAACSSRRFAQTDFMTARRWGNGLHTLRRFLAYGLDLRTVLCWAGIGNCRALKVLYLVVAVFAQWRANSRYSRAWCDDAQVRFRTFWCIKVARRDLFHRFKLIQSQPSVSNQAPFSRSDEPAARASVSQSAVKERAISAKPRHSNEHYEKWLQIRPEWLRCWRCGRAEKLQTARRSPAVKRWWATSRSSDRLAENHFSKFASKRQVGPHLLVFVPSVFVVN